MARPIKIIGRPEREPGIKEVISMEKEFNEKFNEAVNRYRNSLLFYAKIHEWKTFKDKAGCLFDYLESTEISEFKNRFFRIFKGVIFFLLLMVVIILKINPEASPVLGRVQEIMILFAIAGCSFEVYFLHNIRIYIKGKELYYNKRRARFIRDIETDFKDMTPVAADPQQFKEKELQEIGSSVNPSIQSTSSD